MEAILPMGSNHVRSGHATMRIGQPIATAGMSLKEHKTLTERVRKEVAALSGQELAAIETRETAGAASE